MNKHTRSMFEDSIVVARLEDENAILLLALRQVAKDLRRFRIVDGKRVYYSARLDGTKVDVERVIDELEGHKPGATLGALSARLSNIMKIEEATNGKDR